MSAFFRSLSCAAAVTLLAFAISPLQASPTQEQQDQVAPEPAIRSQVITLASSEPGTKVASPALLAGETEAARSARVARANFREFEKVRLKESSRPERLVLEFHAATTVTAVSATGDFQVTGGTCGQGRSYLAGESCEVELTFTPSGPGNRTGQLKVENTAAATPFLAPLGGPAVGPAISFTPSVVGTVAGSNPGGTTGGLIKGPGQLATDGGDNLYIADPGNHLIRFKDSSGSITTLIGGGTNSLTTATSGFGTQIKLSAPTGVTVDSEGNLYFTDNVDQLLASYFLDSIAVRRVGLGGTAEADCFTSSKCTPASVTINPPTSLAVDYSGNVFMATTYGNGLPGSAISEISESTSPEQFYEVGTTAYNYYSSSNAITADPFGYGNLYYTYLDPGGEILSPTPVCYILGQNSAYTQSTASGQKFWEVAGSGKCGFSGDGGRATSAEISKAVGQFAWDAAGNFYFTDTGNNRVRRVDAANGVIRTIAGNGATGSTGDGGLSTSALLTTPLGLATDSTGQVYVTALTTVANKYSIRTFGTVGDRNLGLVTVAAHSAPQTVLVSNVGNDVLNFTHVGFTSGNTGDFAIDPNTTSCNFTVPLPSGQSCYVGFILTPTAAGTRTAVLTLLDDTTTGSNNIQVTGTGATTATLSPTSETFASRAVGSASGPVTVTLTNTGKGVLTIATGGITITGTNASSFSKTTTCGTTVAVGGSCTISVTFKPTTTGAISAKLTVADNAIVSSQSVTLTGAATAAAVKAALTPGAVTFAAQMPGTTSAAKMISIMNPGSTPMTINAFKITGTNAAAFTQTHSCGATLAAGARCSISVIFKPKAVGAQAANLAVTTSAGQLQAALGGTSTVLIHKTPTP